MFGIFIGSHNDAGVFANSTFGRNLAQCNVDIPPAERLPGSAVGSPFCFVGDEGFSLTKYLMRPFPRRILVTDRERIFNYRLSRARRLIENTFGILVARWQILHTHLKVNVETSEHIIYALCWLHNFLISDEDDVGLYNAPGLVDENGPNGEIRNGHWRQINLNRINAEDVLPHRQNIVENRAPQIRENLADYFISRDGHVPWQRRYI